MLGLARAFWVVLTVSAVVSTAAAAGGGPSGDAATIAFYRQVQGAYRTVHTIVGVRRGYFSYIVAGPVFSYRYGVAAPVGYRHATESLLYLSRNGRITRFVDTAKATGLPGLTVIQDGSGVWARLPKAACYSRSVAAGDIGGVGHPFLGVFGNFRPLSRSGRTFIVRSTYPWTTGQQASEIDRISATTKLMLSERVSVTGQAPFAFTLVALREPPLPPVVATGRPRC